MKALTNSCTELLKNLTIKILKEHNINLKWWFGIFVIKSLFYQPALYNRLYSYDMSNEKKWFLTMDKPKRSQNHDAESFVQKRTNL